EARRARFRCVVVIVDPLATGGGHLVAEGRCDGVVAREPRGTGGFGYDPLFVVDGTGKAMAELDEAEKNRISHRGRAAAVARRHLEALVAARLDEARRVLEASAG